MQLDRGLSVWIDTNPDALEHRIAWRSPQGILFLGRNFPRSLVWSSDIQDMMFFSVGTAAFSD